MRQVQDSNLRIFRSATFKIAGISRSPNLPKRSLLTCKTSESNCHCWSQTSRVTATLRSAKIRHIYTQDRRRVVTAALPHLHTSMCLSRPGPFDNPCTGPTHDRRFPYCLLDASIFRLRGSGNQTRTGISISINRYALHCTIPEAEDEGVGPSLPGSKPGVITAIRILKEKCR